MTDFHSLYEKYVQDVRRFALLLSGNDALADDLTSETFVRVWTSRGEIRQATVKAYRPQSSAISIATTGGARGAGPSSRITCLTRESRRSGEARPLLSLEA